MLTAGTSFVLAVPSVYQNTGQPTLILTNSGSVAASAKITFLDQSLDPIVSSVPPRGVAKVTIAISKAG
jgi:hypothetical protein